MKLRGLVAADLAAEILKVLDTPYWWIVPLIVVVLALLAMVAIVVYAVLHLVMACRSDIEEWRPAYCGDGLPQRHHRVGTAAN